MAYQPINLSRCTYNGGSDWSIPEDTVGVADGINFNAGETWSDAKNGVFSKISSGYVYEKDIPNEALADGVSGVNRGLVFPYTGVNYAATGDQTREQRINLMGEYSQGYQDICIYMKCLQPKNYFKRAATFVYFSSSDIATWEAGDFLSVTTDVNGQQETLLGEIAVKETSRVVLREADIQSDYYWANKSITNINKGQTVSSASKPIGMPGSPPTNDKTFIAWNGPSENYSSGQMSITTDARGSFDTGGKKGDGYPHSRLQGSSGEFGINQPSVNRDDNGKIIEWWYVAKRETAEGASDAEIKFYHRAPSTNNEIVQLVNSTGLTNIYTEEYGNKFGCCYLFGSSNAYYTENTDWYVLEFKISSVPLPELENVQYGV